jgi:hypothetical protein
MMITVEDQLHWVYQYEVKTVQEILAPFFVSKFSDLD